MSGIIAVVGARGQRATNVRPEVSFTFDEIVALFDPNVVSYWKFQSIVATVSPDEKGIANATVTGSPEQNIPTIVKRDTISDGAPTDGKCIAWPGTTPEAAQAAHNAAHKTAVGTVVVYFQRDIAKDGQLIMADPTPVAVGGIGISVSVLGAISAYIRGAGGTPVSVNGGNGDVIIDRAYTLILKWGSPGGISLALWNDAGALVRRATNASTIGLAGTSPIRFGATHADTNQHDGPYGRVIWMNRRITDNEEVLLAQANSVAHSADLYRSLELGMSPPPISLWGMGELSGATIVDAVGPRNGTFAGVIGYNSMDIPDDSINGAINFGAGTPPTGSGTVPPAGLSLPAYTLSFWFIANQVPVEGDLALPLINKCAATAVAGDFSCYLRNNDGDVLQVRVRDAANNILDISTSNNTIVAGVQYHVCIRADSTGVELNLNGKFIDKATAHTIGWSINSQPLQFAHGLNFSATGNCILDEICLFNRVITGVEMAALAQRTTPPVAVADPTTVIENTTTELNVIDNDEYVGVPTIAIMADPGVPDSVAIVSAPNTLPSINYIAGGVGPGGANRNFQYRLTDINGISNTVTCPVTIQDSGFVADPIANCYTHTTSGAGTTINVSTMQALEDAIDAAVPGTQIVVADGTYTGGLRTFNPQGTVANPIVVRPADAPPNHGRGTVIINDALWTLATTSARLVITNIHFNNAEIKVNGSHHRIARCQFRDLNHYAIWALTASDLRISHCDFSGYRRGSLTDHGCIMLDCVSLRQNVLQRVMIDYCHVHDIEQAADHDPTNLFQVGSSCGSWNRKNEVIIDHCRIDNIRRVGSGEFIVNKTSEVTYRYCTFTNMAGGVVPNPIPASQGGRTNYSQQYLQQRAGSGIEVRSCWLGVPLYVYDDMNVGAPIRNPLIIGNRMTGGFDINLRAGNDRPGQGGAFRPMPYAHCTDGRCIGNVLDQGHIIVGNNPGDPAQPPGPPNFYAAASNNVVVGSTNPRRNRRLDEAQVWTLQNEVGTTFNDDTATDYGDTGRAATSPPTFTPAEQLTPSQVGLLAPDPLCPIGPQN